MKLMCSADSQNKQEMEMTIILVGGQLYTVKIIIYESSDSEQRMKLESPPIRIHQGKSRMISQQTLVIEKIGHYHSLVNWKKTQVSSDIFLSGREY
jgi:hypothetical protein